MIHLQYFDCKMDEEEIVNIEVEEDDESSSSSSSALSFNSGEEMDEEELEEEDQKEKIKINQPDLSKIPAKVKSYWSKFNEIKLAQHFKLPVSEEVPKSVCAKLITPQDIVIECYDCQTDPTCIICMDCFKNGNHEGHRYVAKKAGGGCCDCGDIEAWKQSGFCKTHTGEFKQFEINKKVTSAFESVFNGLVYQYFYLNIQKKASASSYTQILIKDLRKLNDSDLFYNKLTSIALSKPLPTEYSLNQQLDKRTILQNILTYNISKKHIKDWFDLFIEMFPYYPSKLAIVKHYIGNFGLLVNGSKNSISCASSLSCQLLTSHKIVKQYAQQNKTGLGQNTPIPSKVQELQNFYFMMFHDLNFITNLIEGAPLAYWKMHILAGLDNIFYYQDFIKKRAQKTMKQSSEAQKLIHFINFVQIEHSLLNTFKKIMKIIKNEPLSLTKVITFLWKKCEELVPQDCNNMAIFRPYQRCLGIALYTYFDYNLENIEKSSQKLFKQVLQQDENQSKIILSSLIKKLLRTYFQYAKCMAEPGLANTLYSYIYFYKIKSRFISSVDIVSLKIFILLQNAKLPLSFNSIIEVQTKQVAETLRKQKQVYFQHVLALLNYLYVGKSAEINIAYEIDSQCQLYTGEMRELIVKIFKEKKGHISQEQFKQCTIDMMHPEAKFIDEWIKGNAKVVKQRKQLCLENIPNDEIGLNFSDFWTNVKPENKYQDPKKTLYFITGYGENIFSAIWNQVTVKSLESVFGLLYPDTADPVSENALIKIIPIYCELKQNENLNALVIREGIIEKYKNHIPAEYGQMTGLEDFANVELEVLKNDKIEKLKMLKAKKLEKFKSKQLKFLESMAKEEEPMPQPKLCSIPSESQYCNGNICCICRNDNPSNFVYLARLEARNHEKLLGLGAGVECISFTSCGHLFDHKCVENLFKKQKIIKSIECPLCKSYNNIILPIQSTQTDYVKDFIDRVIQILFSLRETADLYEELIKSFYHYFLLSIVNPIECFKKRSKVYRTILRILINTVPQDELTKLYEKFKAGNFSLQFDNDLQDQKKDNRMQIFRLLLGDNSEIEIPFMNKESSVIKSPEKKKQSKKKKKAKENKYQTNSSLFVPWISKIFHYVISQQNTEHSMEIEEDSIPTIALCLRSLVQADFDPSKITYEKSNISSLKLLIELPPKYTQIGSKKKCSQCDQIATDLIMCLMCGWTGCQTCEKGYAKTHVSENHGQVGVIVSVKKAAAYYYANYQSILAGSIYQDEWGNPIKLSKQWDEFELNSNLMETIEKNLKLDEIPMRAKSS